MPRRPDHRLYRELAEESRKKAETVKEPTLRQSYLDLAASYDKLADTLERPLGARDPIR